MGGGGAGVAPLAHLVDRGVVHISVAALEEVFHEVLQQREIVGGVGNHVGLDAERLDVVDKSVLVLGLFLGGVGVVKPQNHLALVHLGVGPI